MIPSMNENLFRTFTDLTEVDQKKIVGLLFEFALGVE